MLTIAVLGTFDTKGTELAFVADAIRELGVRAITIDCGSRTPTVRPDVSQTEVLRVFTHSLGLGTNATAPVIADDRGQAVALMGKAAAIVLRQHFDRGVIDGVIALGGSGGTSIATNAMRGLPLGFPKVMVTTMASGDVSAYIGASDLLMFPSIVDISGLNRISIGVLRRAAAAVVGMSQANASTDQSLQGRPVIAASMFGNTTRCVAHAQAHLDQAGYETIVFHATGSGGRAMESLIESGMVAGVLDLTTTEWADEIVGGVLSAGPHRLEAAARLGVPAVIAPGCLDMVNFGEPSSVPSQFQGRRFYQHNPHVTLMRTTPVECEAIGRMIASKLNQSTGPVQVLFPKRAISVISAPGQAFHDPHADQMLCDSLQSSLRPEIPFDVLDCEINDPVFAEQAVASLLKMLVH